MQSSELPVTSTADPDCYPSNCPRNGLYSMQYGESYSELFECSGFVGSICSKNLCGTEYLQLPHLSFRGMANLQQLFTQFYLTEILSDYTNPCQ